MMSNPSKNSNTVARTASSSSSISPRSTSSLPSRSSKVAWLTAGPASRSGWYGLDASVRYVAAEKADQDGCDPRHQVKEVVRGHRAVDREQLAEVAGEPEHGGEYVDEAAADQDPLGDGGLAHQRYADEDGSDPEHVLPRVHHPPGEARDGKADDAHEQIDDPHRKGRELGGMAQGAAHLTLPSEGPAFIALALDSAL